MSDNHETDPILTDVRCPPWVNLSLTLGYVGNVDAKGAESRRRLPGNFEAKDAALDLSL